MKKENIDGKHGNLLILFFKKTHKNLLENVENLVVAMKCKKKPFTY